MRNTIDYEGHIVSQMPEKPSSSGPDTGSERFQTKPDIRYPRTWPEGAIVTIDGYDNQTANYIVTRASDGKSLQLALEQDRSKTQTIPLDNLDGMSLRNQLKNLHLPARKNNDLRRAA